jgi:hypothetical protein
MGANMGCRGVPTGDARRLAGRDQRCTFVRCDADHLWSVRKYSTRVRRASTSDPTRKTRVEEAPWKTLTTRELSENTGRRWQIPELPAVWFDGVDLEMDPYTLGVFLGDGCWPQTGTVSVSTDREIIESLGWSVGQSVENSGKSITLSTVPLRPSANRFADSVWHTCPQREVRPEQYLRAAPHSDTSLRGSWLPMVAPDPRKSAIENS